MLLKNSTGLYKQTKQIELSKVMFCLIIMMMIESVLHTHTHLQTTKCYCKLTKGIVSYSSVYKSGNLHYNRLGCWIHCLINQASDGLRIILIDCK